MEKTNLLYEGKAKKVYETNDPALLIRRLQGRRHRLRTAEEGTITGKGAINNQMTNYLMGQLEKAGVPPTLWRS